MFPTFFYVIILNFFVPFSLENLGCISEKLKNVWFFARFALTLHPEYKRL